MGWCWFLSLFLKQPMVLVSTLTFIMLLLLIILTSNFYKISSLHNYIQAHNVLFKSKSDIHTSTNAYTVSFALDVRNLVRQTYKLKEEYSSFLQDYDNLKAIPVFNNASHVNAFIQLIDNEYMIGLELFDDIRIQYQRLSNITKLCKSRCLRRQKRGLLPFVGEIFNSLFSISTDEHLNEISKDIDVVRNTQTSIVHNIEKYYTVINSTILAVNENRAAINEISDYTESFEQSLLELNTEQKLLYQEVGSFKLLFTRYSQLLTGNKAYLRSYLIVKDAITSLESKLESILSNLVTPEILPPDILRHTLMLIKYRLPLKLSLPYDFNENLYKYYKIGFSRAYKEAYGWQIVVKFPVYDATSQFTVYELLHIPIFLQVNDNYINSTAHYITDTKYIGISSDNNKIIYLDENKIDMCLNQDLHFCFISEPIYFMPLLEHDCIAALFLSKSSIPNLCRTTLKQASIHHPIATWLDANVWAITTPITTKFQILCHNTSTSITFDPPFGILRLQTGCSAVNDVLTIPNQIPKHLAIDVDIPIINITKLQMIWDPIKSLNKHDITIHRHNFNKLSPLLNDLSIPQFANQAERSYTPDTTPHTSTYFAIAAFCLVTIIVFIIIGTFGFKYRKRMIFKKNTKSNDYDMISTALPEIPSAPTERVKSHCCETTT